MSDDEHAERCKTLGCGEIMGVWTRSDTLVQAEGTEVAVTEAGRLELRCPRCGAWSDAKHQGKPVGSR